MTSSTSLSFSCVIKPRSSKWRMHFYIGVDSNLLLASFFLFVLRARAVVGSEQWWARRPFFFGIIKRFYEQLAVLFAPRASHKIPVFRLVSSLVLISRYWFINSHLESRGCVCLLYPSSILSRRMFTSPFTYTDNRGSSPCVVSARRSAQYHNAFSKDAMRFRIAAFYRVAVITSLITPLITPVIIPLLSVIFRYIEPRVQVRRLCSAVISQTAFSWIITLYSFSHSLPIPACNMIWI